MSHRPIIDAGPGLNFLSINQERLLIGVLGKLSAPETVQREVFDKARQDERFRAAAGIWRKLAPNWMQILSDDQTPELAAVVQRITRQPMAERLKRPKDLGEVMVIAHAVVIAEAGGRVTVLIDDGEGARTATSEINRLERLRRSGRPVGTFTLVGTLSVLERAVQKKQVSDKADMRHLYRRLRELDDGLPPIETTRLLSPDLWR
ncbi:hypothetical protein SAMN05421803_10941 [Nocardiopsis flavescens]|uniref:Uncharacterized protein n=1 Tax=Nocardiopsis flavescens TaxID=758803 RepID=A0A1M6LSI9_9ACTN|nr:hypothetical protein [Nocardiopsis flavescens]SHJ74150.1 hypothetical protein SAMN05421803_10941 [Nocardiopsis flavescens]